MKKGVYRESGAGGGCGGGWWVVGLGSVAKHLVGQDQVGYFELVLAQEG